MAIEGDEGHSVQLEVHEHLLEGVSHSTGKVLGILQKKQSPLITSQGWYHHYGIGIATLKVDKISINPTHWRGCCSVLDK